MGWATILLSGLLAAIISGIFSLIRIGKNCKYEKEKYRFLSVSKLQDLISLIPVTEEKNYLLCGDIGSETTNAKNLKKFLPFKTITLKP